MFNTENILFHPLLLNPKPQLPQLFNFPFCYQPHNLCIMAADEVMAYLKTQQDFNHNFGLDSSKQGLKIGKMFGIMVIETPEGEIGYIVSFSGKLAESNEIKGFVPPIYDILKDDGFYKKGEAYLNVLNDKIEALENNPQLALAQSYLDKLEADFSKNIEDFKRKAKEDKLKRNQLRVEAEQHLSTKEKDQLIEDLRQQSIRSKLDLKYLKIKGESLIATAKSQLSQLIEPIEDLKVKRKALSADLQKQIHEHYRFLNSKGQIKDLIDIFKETDLGYPPAAAGECAAPKLFQYAYNNQLKPLAMAEFWWGTSPKSEVRQHGQFYPSCRGKCEPILGHMMEGLNVEPNPIELAGKFEGEIEIMYEDDFLLVINKPHEFLSVPGKTVKDSVLTRLHKYLPNATGPLLLHRLDMSTSGLLLVAKNEWTHKNLQKQFINRSIKKRYVALLDGIIKETKGVIELPLRVDLNNRPRQLVCYEHGKLAKTKYNVIKVENNKTRIYFFPITGRTHQLRVHSAHHRGLNIPIVGDDLYGTPANRLHLHAESLSFIHPMNKSWVSFSCDVPF